MVDLHKSKVLIGHSVGAMAAMYYQYKYHDESTIGKIVSIGAPSTLDGLMQFYKKTLKYNQTVEQAIDVHVYHTLGFRIKDFCIHNYVKGINVQGLLIHDELDEVAPVTASEKIHRNWKNSQFIKTKGLGHSLHQDEVNERIITFLAS